MIARSLVWWKPPETVDTLYLIRRAMEMGTPEMLGTVREKLGDPLLLEALMTAEPGSFSERSWNYWHVVFGLRPTPPLPQRSVPDSPYVSPESLIAQVRLLRVPEPKLFQRQDNTVTLQLQREEGPVKVSFFGAIDFGQICSPDCSADNRLKIASAGDLLALKLGVIHQRVEAKDYLDIHALLKAGLRLADGLSYLDALHPLTTNWTIALKTLVYFKGGDLEELPDEVKSDLEVAVRQVRDVPKFSGIKTPIGTT